MAKMWAGRTEGQTNRAADDFNSSIRFDSRMFREDIKGSMAHAAMLGYKNIISEKERDEIIDGLDGILKDIEASVPEYLYRNDKNNVRSAGKHEKSGSERLY